MGSIQALLVLFTRNSKKPQRCNSQRCNCDVSQLTVSVNRATTDSAWRSTERVIEQDSSGMHTTRSVTASPSMLCSRRGREVPGPERWYLVLGGACLVPGGGRCIPASTEADTPMNRITDTCETRMHSSRMCTGRTLTVFWWRSPPQKIPPAQKIPPQKNTPPTTPPKKYPPKPPPKLEQNLERTPPPRGQTHACENITLAKTSFRPVNITLPQLRCGR